MSRRRSLTAAQKRDAIMQCDRISRQLRELAMETLNRHAKIYDTDCALRLAASVERLRDRVWKYPAERRKAEVEANRKRRALASHSTITRTGNHDPSRTAPEFLHPINTRE